MAFAHLHCHSEFSALDGLSTTTEIAERAAADGNEAAAITDHGTCAVHPEFQRSCDDAGIKPVFGMETYFVPDRLLRPESGDKVAQKALRANRHLVLLAATDRGLHDLWAASTEASATGQYYKPRMDYELLGRYGSELFATSACLGGVVSDMLADPARHYNALVRLKRFRDIFQGRFYLEIQSNALPEQIALNKALAEVGEMLDIPLVAAADAHFPTAAEADLHRLWMAAQTSPSQDDYWHYIHMHTEAETRKALGYMDPAVVDRAIWNANDIASQCNARIGGHAEPPVFTKGGTHVDDSNRLLDLCLANFHLVPRNNRKIYIDRLEREWQLVADKRLAGCYLMVHDVCAWVRSQGIVQSFRGSAAGSLMSYLLGITCIDPIASGLMFERFLTTGRTALPDFDMDFPSSQRGRIQDYVVETYGADKVVRVGTVLRYRSKGILNKLSSILADQLPEDSYDDFRAVSRIIDEAESHTAGLGLPWDELMAQQEEYLAPYVAKYPGVFDAASKLVGRLSSYGQHPAGLVVSTDAALVSQLPMRAGEKGQLISQFDFRDLEAQGFLKLDFLTIRTLDSIQETLRLIEERTGQRLDPFTWKHEYGDPQVWDEIGSGHTLGMFQVETSLGQQTCRRMRPRTIADLSALVALVRPGPRNSGLAESYFRRRAGGEEPDFLHPRLEEWLRDQYGIMIFQEDILAACTILAGYDSAEADEVRKILGKKKMNLIGAAGEKFVSRCAANGVEEKDAQEIWDKMAEFGRYGFNKSHSVSYAILSFWTAWLKSHYPVETFTGIMSTLKDKDRIPAFAMDARRMGLKVLPPDARFCGGSFVPEGLGIRYGLSAIKGVGPAALTSITAAQPYTTYNGFVKESKADKGVLYALARGGALDALVPSRRGLVLALEADRTGASTTCVHKEEGFEGPEGLPCHYDWDSEPVPVRIGAKGQELKSKPRALPKRCTRACRNYTPPEPLSPMMPEYSAEDLWRIDDETYGCWLSDRIFARLDELGEGTRRQARDIALMLPGAPAGSYPLLAVAGGIHPARTRSGSTMWWMRLATEVSQFDVAVFSPRRDDEPDLVSAVRFMRRGTLVLATVMKSRYVTNGSARTSWRLEEIQPLGGN